MAEQALETKLGRLPEVAGAGRIDSSARTQHLLKGLEQFSTSLKAFGKAKKAREIQNDIITARTAFAVNKELPDNLRPEAEIAYNNLIAEKETSQFFRLLQDDAEVFGNGLLTDDENYPDHTSKQAAYSDFIDQSVQTFYGHAQLNEAQQESILEAVNESTNNLKNLFTILNAKDIKLQKETDSAQAIQEDIFAGINRLKTYDVVMEGHNLTLQDFFTPDWHDKVQEKILTANPHLSKSRADLMIIEQLDLIASDPDNPQPDLVEYLTAPRKGGKPSFSAVHDLTAKIKTVQNAARAAFIANSDAIDKREGRLLKQRQALASSGAMKTMLEQLSNADGEKDPLKLEKLLARLHPDIKESELRAIVKHAGFLNTSSGLLGDPDLAAIMRGEASRGDLTNTELSVDPRGKKLSKKQYAAVLQANFEFQNGAVTRNRTAMNDYRKTLKKEILDHLRTGSEIKSEGKTWKADSANIYWDDQQGTYVGFSPRINAMVDRLVLQYEKRINEIEDDPENADIIELKKQMQTEKENLYKDIKMLGKESGPKQFVRTKESTAAKELQDYKDQATAPWRAQMAEDAQYDEFDPLVHQAVPPSKIRIIKDADNKLQAIIKARTAATGATTFDDTGVTQFAMEGISEKDISSAKPVRPVPLGVPDTGPSAI